MQGKAGPRSFCDLTLLRRLEWEQSHVLDRVDSRIDGPTTEKNELQLWIITSEGADFGEHARASRQRDAIVAIDDQDNANRNKE